MQAEKGRTPRDLLTNRLTCGHAATASRLPGQGNLPALARRCQISEQSRRAGKSSTAFGDLKVSRSSRMLRHDFRAVAVTRVAGVCSWFGSA